jgi:hypothetical protein
VASGLLRGDIVSVVAASRKDAASCAPPIADTRDVRAATRCLGPEARLLLRAARAVRRARKKDE